MPGEAFHRARQSRQVLQRQLDFTLEAENLAKFRANFRGDSEALPPACCLGWKEGEREGEGEGEGEGEKEREQRG